jgi:hypothetical protein
MVQVAVFLDLVLRRGMTKGRVGVAVLLLPSGLCVLCYLAPHVDFKHTHRWINHTTQGTNILSVCVTHTHTHTHARTHARTHTHTRQ